MKHHLNTTALLFFLMAINVQAQNCGCTITEVENNTVTPCNMVVGTTVVVSSVSEFQSARPTLILLVAILLLEANLEIEMQ